VRPVLAERDIAALYLLLKGEGITQRQIAELTGQSQSEVSEILAGRKVLSYDLLVRIAEGFHVPRELMGLSYGEHSAYGGQGTLADPPQGVNTEMLRRRLIELGAGLALGAPAAKLAPLLKRLELPDPAPVPLPSQLGAVHVAKVRDLTRRLGDARRVHGPDPEVSGAAAAWARRLLDVPGTDAVRKALMVAVAELHIEAGWEAFDAGLYDRAMCHYGHALKLATETGDAYCQAVALNRAGLATVEYGDPNEGLKLLQVGTVTALGIPADEPRPVVVGGSGRAAVQAIALADSATALSRLDYPEAARAADTALAKSRELWQPHPDQPNGDLDRPAAWNSTEAASTRQNRSPRRRCAAGKASARSATPTPASSWPPSTSGPGSLTGYEWPTARSPQRRSSPRSESAGDLSRWWPRWRPGPAATRGSWPGWPGRSPQPGRDPPRRNDLGGPRRP